jgi:recombinational DNA repair protein RecT
MTNTIEKRTRKEKYAGLIALLNTIEGTEEFVELCTKEIEAIDKKAAKAKERAAEKKTEADELYDKVEATLRGAGALSINDIVRAIAEDDVTSAKVVNRLKKMVDAGLVEKSTNTVEKRRINTYTFIG